MVVLSSDRNNRSLSLFSTSESELQTQKSYMLRHTLHPEREEDQSDYTLETVERVKAVKRASTERDLLCAPWRGRAVANSPILRLDESTVNAGSQKIIQKQKGWEKCKTVVEKQKRKKIN